MREVPVPGSQNALRPSKMGGVQRHGGPVNIPHDQTTTGAQGACISASAAGTSATYSSTCTDSAASKLAFSTGSEVASASWNATLSCPSERCAATASIGWLLSMPTT